MNDTVILYGLTVVLFCVVGLLFVVYRAIQGKMIDEKTMRLSEQAQKLSGQISRAVQQYPELARNPTKNVANALGDIGVEGIMEELGIDPGLLKNPLVKGLVEKYAPRVMEQLSKGGNGAKSEENQIL